MGSHLSNLDLPSFHLLSRLSSALSPVPSSFNPLPPLPRRQMASLSSVRTNELRVASARVAAPRASRAVAPVTASLVPRREMAALLAAASLAVALPSQAVVPPVIYKASPGACGGLGSRGGGRELD